MAELSAVKETERWMHKNPRITVILLASFLVALGIGIGMAVTANIYDSEFTRMFDDASNTQYPIMFHDRLYSIHEINTTDFGFVNRSFDVVYITSKNIGSK